MTPPLSPLAPKSYPDLPDVAGVTFATAEAGIKYKDRTDVLLAVFEPGTSVAGVLTRSLCAAAPVDWCRAHLPGGTARALVVNSGNANAFTGEKGSKATELTAQLAAKAVGCETSEVFLSSTGVIGEPLDGNKFKSVLDDCAKRLKPQPWMEAAKAIMTTDTYPKVATRTLEFDGKDVTINGIAKGSGMIAPDMATMLAYVFTDAPIASYVMQSLLATHVQSTFNAVTVDSDTSTSDTLLAFATAKVDIEPIHEFADSRAQKFGEVLHDLLLELALHVVRDGEGATKQVTVEVTGATTDESAAIVARSIANSPLVKTAIAGEDANWGRVVMAVGKAGEPAARDLLTIRFGKHVVAEKGERSASYNEETVSAYMKGDDLVIGADLGMGPGEAVVYTCDLTHGYIDINGSYRS